MSVTRLQQKPTKSMLHGYSSLVKRVGFPPGEKRLTVDSPSQRQKTFFRVSNLITSGCFYTAALIKKQVSQSESAGIKSAEGLNAFQTCPFRHLALWVGRQAERGFVFFFFF